MNIVPSSEQTCKWRRIQPWFKNGRQSECEKYQIEIINTITQSTCNKTKQRINISNLQFKDQYNLTCDDGYEYTENFDALQIIKEKTFFFNLKMICGQGGAQTRFLREVYWFIKSQLDLLLKENTNNVYFVNILDGDECYKNKNKFEYLLKKEKYDTVRKNVFCGDMYSFQSFFSDVNK